MGLDDLIKQGEALYKGQDGKVDTDKLKEDAMDAYKVASLKTGTTQDKAKMIYSEIQANHSSSDKKDDKKDDKKSDE